MIYTSIDATINPEDRRADHLADLAIESVSLAPPGQDGITYLTDATRNGIVTPLSRDYEASILIKTGTQTLEQAIESVSQS